MDHRGLCGSSTAQYSTRKEHLNQEHDSWGNNTSLEGGNVRKKINETVHIKTGFKIGQKNKRKDSCYKQIGSWAKLSRCPQGQMLDKWSPEERNCLGNVWFKKALKTHEKSSEFLLCIFQ